MNGVRERLVQANLIKKIQVASEESKIIIVTQISIHTVFILYTHTVC